MKPFLPLIFLGLTLSVFAAAIIYLSKRMHFFFASTHVGGWYALFIALAVYMIAGLIVLSNTTSNIGSVFYQLAAVTMGLMLYFLMAVLVLDALNLVAKLPPRYIGLGAIVLTVLVVGFGILNSFNIRTTHHTMALKGLDQEVKAVHLSDIHIGHFRALKWMKEIVAKTNAENPDVVFITGDLFDGKINLTQEVLQPLKLIKAPVYFVDGNHDGYSGVRQIKAYLRQVGVRVLENEVEHVLGLQIVGLNHMMADAGSSNVHAAQGSTMAEVFPSLSINDRLPAILLHHSPDGVEYAHQYGIDLYLSGHTHGGQQFPVTLINELLFKYNRGLDQYKDTKILVSEGVGTFGPPLRIGTKSEILSLTLVPEK